MNSVLIIFCVLACVYAKALHNTNELNSNTQNAYATDHLIQKSAEDEIKQRPPAICKYTSVCAWSMYNPKTLEVERTAINPTCVCGPGKRCKIVLNNLAAHMYTHQCVSSDL